jgi:hypothetical protein
MTAYAHDTVPTEFLEANGMRFAYRRFGTKSGVPMVFFQHFMGNLDDHDPALTNAFAADREVPRCVQLCSVLWPYQWVAGGGDIDTGVSADWA